jgi:2-polyprenyl-3-methyl-5-hydroxy-6-metoxy-1,4-benzoquinol methylase
VTNAAAAACPCCGGAGRPYADGCRDRICHVPGVWSYLRCAACGSLWQTPAPAAGDIAAFYPADYPFTRTPARDAFAADGSVRQRLKRLCLSASFGYAAPRASTGTRMATTLLRAMTPFFRHRVGAAVRYVDARPDARLLDVGCGNGGFLMTMRGLGWEVEGIEPDAAAARHAQAAQLPVQVATVDQAQLRPASFDAITLSHVIEHLPDPAAALDRLARALKPGGVLVTLSPNPEGLLANRFRASWFELDCPRHLVIPSRRALHAIGSRSGLQVTTFTSMRLFRWAWPASHAIRTHGHLSRGDRSNWRQHVGAIVSQAAAFLPGKGEEIVCIAVRLASQTIAARASSTRCAVSPRSPSCCFTCASRCGRDGPRSRRRPVTHRSIARWPGSARRWRCSAAR